MFTGVTFEQAMKYYMAGREVIVLDRNSLGANRKGYDTFPFEDLFNNIEFLADLSAVENPEFNKAIKEMISENSEPEPEEEEPEEDMPNFSGGGTEDSTPSELVKSKTEIVEDLVEQGKSPKEIAEITGYDKQFIYQVRYLLKKKREKDEPAPVFEKGHNADRHLCKTCMYRCKSQNANGVGCEYALYHDHTRGCAVEDCNVYKKGDPIKTKPKAMSL